MKRTVWLPAVVFLSWSLISVGGTPAEEKPPSAPDTVKSGTETKPRGPSRKPRVDFFTGTIESLDARAGEIVVKRKKETRLFRFVEDKERKTLEDYKPGDKVIVKHVDGTVLSIIKPGKNRPVPSAKGKAPQAPGGTTSPPAAEKK